MAHAGPFIRTLAAMAMVLGGLPAGARAQAGCAVLDPDLQGSYQGGCVNGKAEGQGTAKGTATYVGEFHEGKKHGRGVKTWPRGDRYQGEFAEDYMHGWGIYVWGARSLYAGDRYEGGLVKDKRNGFGLYIWASGDSYAGPWKDDAVAGRSTPMMIARFRTTRAFLEAMANPGVRVCHESSLGGARERTEAETQNVNKDAQQVSLRITQLGSPPARVAGAEVSVGELVWDDPLNWIPCQ